MRHPRRAALVVWQHPALARAEREHAAFEPQPVHLRAEQLARLVERHGGAVVGLEVDGDHVPRAHVREDLQRLLRTGMVPIAAARGRDGHQGQVDPREPPADLLECARVVAGVSREEHSAAAALDHVSGRGVVPDRVHEVPPAGVVHRNGGDTQAGTLDRLPRFQGARALLDRAHVGLAAGGIQHVGAVVDAPDGPGVEMVDVQVADQRDVDGWQLARSERWRRDARDHDDRPAEVRVGEHEPPPEAEQHRRVSHPERAEARPWIVDGHAANGRIVVGCRAGDDSTNE